MFQGYITTYITITSTTGILLLWLLNSFFKKIEKRNTFRVKKLKKIQTIGTSTPYKKPIERFKDIAIERIASRFSIIRSIITINLLLIWLFALTFPFLERIPKAILSAMVTGGAIIIGIAAKPFVENIISGIVITTSKLINIGDTVVFNNSYGTVEDITMTDTIIRVWDWKRHVIPNNVMLNKEFLNFSLYDQWLWAYVEFWISYDADLNKVKTIAIDAAKSSKKCKSVEEPSFWVMETDQTGYKCWIAAWADSPASSWQLKVDIRIYLIENLQKEGIKTHLHNINESKIPIGIINSKNKKLEKDSI